MAVSFLCEHIHVFTVFKVQLYFIATQHFDYYASVVMSLLTITHYYSPLLAKGGLLAYHFAGCSFLHVGVDLQSGLPDNMAILCLGGAHATYPPAPYRYSQSKRGSDVFEGAFSRT